MTTLQSVTYPDGIVIAITSSTSGSTTITTTVNGNPVISEDGSVGVDGLCFQGASGVYYYQVGLSIFNAGAWSGSTGENCPDISTAKEFSVPVMPVATSCGSFTPDQMENKPSVNTFAIIGVAALFFILLFVVLVVLKPFDQGTATNPVKVVLGAISPTGKPNLAATYLFVILSGLFFIFATWRSQFAKTLSVLGVGGWKYAIPSAIPPASFLFGFSSTTIPPAVTTWYNGAPFPSPEDADFIEIMMTETAENPSGCPAVSAYNCLLCGVTGTAATPPTCSTCDNCGAKAAPSSDAWVMQVFQVAMPIVGLVIMFA